jgi:hypothetical protein
MNLDFMGAELFDDRNSGIAPDLNSSPSSAIPDLASIEQPFDWGESFVMPTDPSMHLARGWIQESTTHPPAESPPQGTVLRL